VYLNNSLYSVKYKKNYPIRDDFNNNHEFQISLPSSIDFQEKRTGS